MSSSHTVIIAEEESTRRGIEEEGVWQEGGLNHKFN